MEQIKDNNNEIEYCTIETYAVFNNIDESILLTNSFLEKFGYVFVSISLEELEKNFSALFGLPKNFEPESQYHLQDSNIIISKEFFNAMISSGIFEEATLLNKKVIFLKTINDSVVELINGSIEKIDIVMKLSIKLQTFINALIQQFRLFKHGDINCSMEFLIIKEKKKIIFKTGASRKQLGNLIYSLSVEEVELLGRNFQDTFLYNSLTELAITNFNLSYNIADVKTKYVTLITCLESLFNQGKDQISHTLSRHLALIISESETEFTDNYYKIKKLYNLRSTIVHGDKPKENLHRITEELQNKVRQAINYCLPLQLNKKQLFDKLNALGFGKV